MISFSRSLIVFISALLLLLNRERIDLMRFPSESFSNPIMLIPLIHGLIAIYDALNSSTASILDSLLLASVPFSNALQKQLFPERKAQTQIIILKARGASLV